MDAKSLFPFPGNPEHEARVLDRYFAGESVEEERQAIDCWIETNPGLAEQVTAFRYAARYPTAARPTPASSALLANFRAKIESEQRRNSHPTLVADGLGPEHTPKFLPSLIHPRPRTTHFGSGSVRNTLHLRSQTLRTWLWTGATIALIVGTVLFTRRVPHMQADATRTYVTNADQQGIITLDDATRVTLAPRTTLRLRRFGTTSRTVELESGEAYFEVTHTSGVPFIVQTGMVTTQVLGTTFLIRHEPGDPHVRIAVTDGKVRVTTPVRAHAEATLTAGQVGDVTDSTTHVSTADDLTPGIEWAPGRIMFRDMPLATVLQTVSRWYGYHFRFADKTFGMRNVTLMISTRSSAEALATIENMLAVNLTIVGDTITLVPQPQRANHSAPRIRTYDVWTPNSEVGR